MRCYHSVARSTAFTPRCCGCFCSRSSLYPNYVSSVHKAQGKSSSLCQRTKAAYQHVPQQCPADPRTILKPPLQLALHFLFWDAASHTTEFVRSRPEPRMADMLEPVVADVKRQPAASCTSFKTYGALWAMRKIVALDSYTLMILSKR